MIPDMIHTPYIAPRISVMAPPPVTAERFVDELLSGLCMPDGGFVAHLAPSGDPFSNGWNAAMKLQASQPTSRCLPMPVNVIFHNPANLLRLKLEHPDIYEQFVTVSESRRFSVRASIMEAA